MSDQTVTQDGTNELLNFCWPKLSHVEWSGDTEWDYLIYCDSGAKGKFENPGYRSPGVLREATGPDIVVNASGGTWQHENFPLKDPDLWLKFAILNPSRERVMRLCTKYGYMHYSHKLVEIFVATHGNYPYYKIGEPYQYWFQEMSILYLAKSIYLSLKDRDTELAQSLFVEASISMQSWDSVFENFKYFASDYDGLIEIIYEIVRKRSRFVRAVLLKSFDSNKMSLSFEPDDLHGAVWFQFAQVLARGTLFKSCSQCGREFSISGYGAHADRKLCSNACKQAAYRARKQQGASAQIATTVPQLHPKESV